MKKSDLVPFKHILCTRCGNIYWYVGEDFDNSKRNKEDKISFICLSPDINVPNSEEYFLESLLANRDGYWKRTYEEARKYDVILVCEIIDNYGWLNFIRKNTFINSLSEVNNWCSKKIIKKIWERIDCEFECY